MKGEKAPGWFKSILIGKPRDLSEKNLFHKLSLVALLAWVGLGADGLSSSCYGPEESFKALGTHLALAPFIAIACILTITVICASYSQLIEVFPGGGGGYLVASKLLSPKLGVVSGCALLVDYVLTIAISVSSGADALFSIFPHSFLVWKLPFAACGVLMLIILNLRGVRESVLIWVPVFFVFIVTHALGIAYAVGSHFGAIPELLARTSSDLSSSRMELGFFGILFLLVHSYSMGAGTYTGIEAVSNGLPILREPRVATGKRTMLYMGASLSFMVGGLLVAYLLCRVSPQEGKTLNAVLFNQIAASWPTFGWSFVFLAQGSAAILLFIAAQTGFLDGPRVLANMAADRWFPSRFSLLSDRFVTQNGIFLMGGAALIVLLSTHGALDLLVVLYSINVFITFTLSQAGMVCHWWKQRKVFPGWWKKLAVNGTGVLMTSFILASLCSVKFWEGGWVTLLLTGILVCIAFMTRRHYERIQSQFARLDSLVPALLSSPPIPPEKRPVTGPRTAAILVNGFNGLGLHTLLAVHRVFPNTFNNFVFIQVGLLDAGNFKGVDEINHLKQHLSIETGRYVSEMKRQGYESAAFTEIGHDLVQTATKLAQEVSQTYPHVVFFGGQLVFEKESLTSRFFHNYAVFAIQRELYRRNQPFVIMPIRA
ncbi:MAG: amino acid transporter [Lentisphaerae bacterium GWF2_52_8]|nr:MAG: amino acid transporter [Lentisphaerae bacterium GWF2_52_8]